MIIKWDLAFFYLKAGQILALFNENKKPLIKSGLYDGCSKNWKRGTNQSGRGSPAVRNIGESSLI